MRIAIYTLVLSLSFGIALIPGRLMATNNAYQEGQYAQALDYFSAQLSLPNVEKGPLY